MVGLVKGLGCGCCGDCWNGDLLCRVFTNYWVNPAECSFYDLTDVSFAGSIYSQVYETQERLITPTIIGSVPFGREYSVTNPDGTKFVIMHENGPASYGDSQTLVWVPELCYGYRTQRVLGNYFAGSNFKYISGGIAPAGGMTDRRDKHGTIWKNKQQVYLIPGPPFVKHWFNEDKKITGAAAYYTSQYGETGQMGSQCFVGDYTRDNSLLTLAKPWSPFPTSPLMAPAGTYTNAGTHFTNGIFVRESTNGPYVIPGISFELRQGTTRFIWGADVGPSGVLIPNWHDWSVEVPMLAIRIQNGIWLRQNFTLTLNSETYVP